MSAGSPDIAELMQHVQRAVTSSSIFSNNYFASLRSGQMTLADFQRSQKQFFFAVGYFSRPMAALLARIPDSASRAALIHNLADEHGLSDEDETPAKGFDPQLAHDRTFLQFLRTIGVESSEFETTAPQAPVLAFNSALLGVCMMEPVELAFSCLGVIEYAFADISAGIGNAIVDRQWITAGQLVHYKLHAQIDKHHAAEFFQSVAAAWGAGTQSQRMIQRGIDLGLYLFNRLYADLALAAGDQT